MIKEVVEGKSNKKRAAIKLNLSVRQITGLLLNINRKANLLLYTRIVQENLL